MAEQGDSGIDYVDKSWGCWRGCHHVSAGCDYCYGKRDMKRFGHDPHKVVRAADATFYAPLKWKKPQRVFVCPWSDFFIEEADEWRPQAWSVVRDTPHKYLFVTKRPERINFPALAQLYHFEKQQIEDMLSRIWFIPTCENQEMLEKRLPIVLDLKARGIIQNVGVSIEPMLSKINLDKHLDMSYNPVKEVNKNGYGKEPREDSLSGCVNRGVENRSTGANMEAEKTGLGSLEKQSAGSEMQKGEGGTRQRKVFRHKGDVRKQEICSSGISSNILSSQRGNSQRDDDKSYRWQQKKQQDEQSGNSNLFSERTTHDRCVENGPGIKSTRHKECDGQIDGSASCHDSETKGKGRKPEINSGQVQCDFPTHISHSIRKNSYISIVILGCESGPKARPCKLEWMQSVVDQCDEAGIPVYVKQIHLNGKLVKDIKQFPLGLRRREDAE